MNNSKVRCFSVASMLVEGWSISTFEVDSQTFRFLWTFTLMLRNEKKGLFLSNSLVHVTIIHFICFILEWLKCLMFVTVLHTFCGWNLLLTWIMIQNERQKDSAYVFILIGRSNGFVVTTKNVISKSCINVFLYAQSFFSLARNTWPSCQHVPLCFITQGVELINN